MSRPCSICTHTACGTIDQALVDGLSYRSIADVHGVSKSALLRHQQHQEPRAVTDTVTVTGQAPAPCTCTRIDWQGLSYEAHRLHEFMQERRDPYAAVEVLKLTLALLEKLTASACAPPRLP